MPPGSRYGKYIRQFHCPGALVFFLHYPLAMEHNENTMRKLKFGILKKFLAGFLVLSLVPMMVLGSYTWVRMNHVVELLMESSRTALTQTSMSLLQARAGAIATQVEQFLDAVVSDLNMLATLPPVPGIYTGFYRVHHRTIWIPTDDPLDTKGIKQTIPLYTEISFADTNGQEQILIREGRAIASSRDLSTPFLSQFGREDFLKKPWPWLEMPPRSPI